MMDLIWNFELKDDIMSFSRISPDESATVINTFMRK